MSNAFFKKTVKNVRKHRDIKLLTTETKTNYLLSEPDYHTTKCFSQNLLTREMKKKKQLFMNKSVYLGLSILEISRK